MMKKIFARPEAMTKVGHLYCPGCGHGIVHRIIAEVIDNLNIRQKTIGIAPVGCAVFAYDYFNFDVSEAPHGRPPAVATAIKRLLPDRVVFTYQGDGDLAAIGTAETIHAASRGENITVIFINNANYGMTGGQMAPTTILGQKTATTPTGRKAEIHGYPLAICELLKGLPGVGFIARTTITTAAYVLRTRQLIKKAFECQLNKKGFSLVEVLSPCPVDWKMTPQQAQKWIETEMVKTFPLGIFKE